MSIWQLTTLGIAILLLTFAGSNSPGAVYRHNRRAHAATGVEVPDPSNKPGLMSDCAVLLAARDRLGGNRHAELDGVYSNGAVGRRHYRRISAARHTFASLL